MSYQWLEVGGLVDGGSREVRGGEGSRDRGGGLFWFVVVVTGTEISVISLGLSRFFEDFKWGLVSFFRLGFVRINFG